MAVFRLYIIFGLILVAFLSSTDSALAQDDVSRGYFGIIGGGAVLSGPPDLQNGLYGEMQAGLQVKGPLWVVIGAGGIFTSAGHDPTFTITLYHLRASLTFDLPVRLPRNSVPYLMIGPILLDFDPTGRVDAEDNFIRTGIDGGGGIRYNVYQWVSLKFEIRVATVTTDVIRFPLNIPRGTTRRTMQTYVGSGIHIRF